MDRKISAKKVATLALFTALSLIMFIIENQFPSMFIPGARMGLANIFSFAALVMYSAAEGFAVVAARTVLGAIFAGSFSTVIYSFTAGIVSMAVSALLIRFVYPKVSLISVSVASAVTHNTVQCLVFCLMAGTPYALAYLPYLMLLGILSGAIVGAVTMLLFKKVPLSVLYADRKKKPAKGAGAAENTDNSGRRRTALRPVPEDKEETRIESC